MAKLTNIDVQEISLVDAPANRKKFIIIKETDMNKDLEQLMQLLLGNSFQKAENQESAMIEALKVIEKYMESLPNEIYKSIQTIIYQLKLSDEQIAKMTMDIEKAGKSISETNATKIKNVMQLLNELLPDTEKIISQPDTPEEKVLKALTEINKRITEIENQKSDDGIAMIIGEIKKRLDVVEQNKGIPKGQAAENNDTIVDSWPSLPL